MGCNRTGPPCSVGCPTTHAPGGRPAHPPAALQTLTYNDNRRRQEMTANRRQQAKQYWPIRWASNN